MNVALIVGLLFLAGAAYNFFGPEPNPSEALAGLAIASLLIGLFAFIRAQRSRDEAFLRWVNENSSTLDGGKAQYAGAVITPATKLVRFELALSFLVVSFRIPSRLYIANRDPTFGVAAVFTGLSLLLGWWGIPWGPIYTVKAIATNLRGGSPQTVADLFAAGSF